MFANLPFNSFATRPALPLAGFWYGDAASSSAENVDRIFDIINYISIFFFLLIVTLMVVFIVKYRHRPGHTAQPSPSHSNGLEIFWSVIPMFIVAYLFYTGFVGYMDMRTPPENAYDIGVRATKWKFEFTYPNGASSDELHVMIDQPVRLVQQSGDVLHSLYLPAFRTKMDCVPGRYTYQWFKAIKPGEYDLFCAEYCGKDHSNMNSIVVVHESQAGFDAWLEKINTPPEDPIEWGEQLYSRKGCKQCHTIDGSARAGGGPSFLSTWGNTHTLEGGEKVLGDENYILQSLREPQSQIRQGYRGITMPAFPKSLMKDEEVNALIAFIKSLSEEKKETP